MSELQKFKSYKSKLYITARMAQKSTESFLLKEKEFILRRMEISLLLEEYIINTQVWSPLNYYVVFETVVYPSFDRFEILRMCEPSLYSGYSTGYVGRN